MPDNGMREIHDPQNTMPDGRRVEEGERQRTRARPVHELAQKFGHIWPSLRTGEAVLPPPPPPSREHNPYAR